MAHCGHGLRKETSQKQEIEFDPDMSWLSAKEQEYLMSAEKNTDVEGWCFLWDVARLNGVSWDPSNKGVVSFLETLVQSCPTQVPDGPGLAAAGFVQYWYSKQMEARHERTKAKTICAQKGCQD